MPTSLLPLDCIENYVCEHRKISMMPPIGVIKIAWCSTSPYFISNHPSLVKNYMSNPCLHCGACCAFYRASFYWSEADDAPAGNVPVAMTVQVSPWQRAMRGTDRSKPRCCALQGEIGLSVACSIYPLRASPCRDFPASWSNGEHNPRCDAARRHWGLEPLQPGDFQGDSWVA